MGKYHDLRLDMKEQKQGDKSMSIYAEFTMNTETAQKKKFNNQRTKNSSESAQRIATYSGYISWGNIQGSSLSKK